MQEQHSLSTWQVQALHSEKGQWSIEKSESDPQVDSSTLDLLVRVLWLRESGWVVSKNCMEAVPLVRLREPGLAKYRIKYSFRYSIRRQKRERERERGGGGGGRYGALSNGCKRISYDMTTAHKRSKTFETRSPNDWILVMDAKTILCQHFHLNIRMYNIHLLSRSPPLSLFPRGKSSRSLNGDISSTFILTCVSEKWFQAMKYASGIKLQRRGMELFLLSRQVISYCVKDRFLPPRANYSNRTVTGESTQIWRFVIVEFLDTIEQIPRKSGLVKEYNVVRLLSNFCYSLTLQQRKKMTCFFSSD